MAKAKLKLSIAHQVPGRVRIEHVTANPLTGSVVLHYDVDRHHEFHGRLRPGAPPPTMKIPSAKGNPELLQQISETFAVIPGADRRIREQASTRSRVSGAQLGQR
jgi:hypothetical protein